MTAGFAANWEGTYIDISKLVGFSPKSLTGAKAANTCSEKAKTATQRLRKIESSMAIPSALARNS